MDYLGLVVRHEITDLTLVRADLPGRIHALRHVFFGCRRSHCSRRLVFPADSSLSRWASLLLRLLDGIQTDVSIIPLDLDDFTPFRARVTQAARAIRYGTVVSYGDLAARAGYPGAARAAASVMRRNPLPLVVPCHRVVRADGSIGGFGGATSGRMIALKRRLLACEAVAL